jgi:RimJ/RimL family protein N-acetyltransferase
VTATVPSPVPLVGTHVRLEPLTSAHVPALHAAIAHPAVFAGGFGGGAAGLRVDPAAFAEWARGYFRWDDLPYAVILVGGPHDGALVGTSTLTDLDVPRERIHLGWTAYDPRVWGTVVNAEAKRLLLGLAFDSGFGRVKLQADARNDRSRAAILKLGATFEGVCRRDQRRADGSWRDAAIHSILADEWPAVRAGLDARVAAHEGRPVLFRTPPAS